MWIKIRTETVKFSMPVPLSLAGVAIRAIPEAAFAEMRKKADPPYDTWINKKMALYLWKQCKDALVECAGLEVIHVEAADGTLVSIKI